MRPFPFAPQHGYPLKLDRGMPVRDSAFRPYAQPYAPPKRDVRNRAGLWTRLAMLAVAAVLLVVLGYAMLTLMSHVTEAIQRALSPV